MERLPHETERDFAQRKTFLGWINFVLEQQGQRPIQDPIQDLSDGVALSIILQFLTGKEVKGVDPKAKNVKLRCIANLDLVLRAFEEEGLKFENIGPQDIYDKNYTLIMGMMWRVVRKFHINGIDEQKRKRMSCIASERDEEAEAKASLLDWTNRRLGVVDQQYRITNFNSDFQDGRAFAGLIASYDPSFVTVYRSDIAAIPKMRRAFARAQQVCLVPAILSAEDVSKYPDEHSIMTYLAFFMRRDQVSGLTPVPASGWSTFEINKSTRGLVQSGDILMSVQRGSIATTGSGGFGSRSSQAPSSSSASPRGPAPLPPRRGPSYGPKSFEGLTFRVVEKPEVVPQVGVTYQFSILASRPDGIVEIDALPMRQIKITSAEGDTIPFLLRPNKNSDGVQYLVDMVPQYEGSYTVQILNQNLSPILDYQLKPCVNNLKGVDGNERIHSSMKAKRLDRVSFYGGSSQSARRSSQFPPFVAVSPSPDFSESIGPQISVSPSSPSSSFYSSSSSSPSSSSSSTPSSSSSSSNAPNFDSSVGKRPLFGQTTPTVQGMNRMLKVHLDDDPELERFGLRQACFTVNYDGIGMRASHLKDTLKLKMVQKLDRSQEQKLLEYVQFFVIVELLGNGEHRVVGKCEPLGRWEVSKCPPDVCLMYLPLKTYYEFLVEYPQTRVAVGENMESRIEISDPFNMNKPVRDHGGYLAMVITNELGVQVEYEAVQGEEEGEHIVNITFASAGRYTAMVQYNGHDIQSCPAVLKAVSSKLLNFIFYGPTTHHKKKEEKVGPSFNPRSFFSKD